MKKFSAQQNNGRVLWDAVFSRVGVAVAWILIVFWAVISIGGFASLITEKVHENSADYYMPYVAVGLTLLHVRMLLSAKRTGRLVRDFRAYCAVLAQEPDKSIPDLAATLNLPPREVEEQLKKMCGRSYFNGYIDFKRQRMVFPESEGEGIAVVSCPGCGAANAVSSAAAVCRYCGAPLAPKH